jgi:hypothetical protein
MTGEGMEIAHNYVRDDDDVQKSDSADNPASSE